MKNRKEITEKEYKKRINIVLDYINENLIEDLNYKLLASIASFSPFHFHRIFTSIVGETLHNFIIQARLRRAAHRLMYDSNTIITNLAMELRFSSSAVFARSFKKYYGISASKIRDNKEILPKYKNVKIKPPNKRKLNSIYTKYIDDLNLAYIRYYGPYNSQLNKVHQQLLKWARPRKIITNDTQIIGITYDDPHCSTEKNLRYDACITVKDNITVSDTVNTMTFKPGECAV